MTVIFLAFSLSLNRFQHIMPGTREVEAVDLDKARIQQGWWRHLASKGGLTQSSWRLWSRAQEP